MILELFKLLNSINASSMIEIIRCSNLSGNDKIQKYKEILKENGKSYTTLIDRNYDFSDELKQELFLIAVQQCPNILNGKYDHWKE